MDKSLQVCVCVLFMSRCVDSHYSWSIQGGLINCHKHIAIVTFQKHDPETCWTSIWEKPGYKNFKTVNPNFAIAGDSQAVLVHTKKILWLLLALQLTPTLCVYILTLLLYIRGDIVEWDIYWEYWFWDTYYYRMKFLLYATVFSWTKFAISLEL